MNKDNIIAADSSPYPELRIQRANPAFARKLCAAFGGQGGEFGTIAQYIYQSIIFAEKYPEYSEILRRIAIVEMKHLDMIGRLVNMLGGNLIYGSYPCSDTAYWNGTGVNYTKNPAGAMISDLEGEQKAYSEYISLARQSGDRFVFAVLTRIALDEMVHSTLLKTLIGELSEENSL